MAGTRRPRVSMEGIVATPWGWRAWVWVKGRNRSKRYPHDTDLAVIQSWRAKQKADATTKGKPAKTTTFAEDVDTYLALVHAMPTIATRTAHLADWREALGPARDRSTVTALEVATILAGWQKNRHYSPHTLNHRRSALSNFYFRLDPGAPNPARGVPKFDGGQPAPRGLPVPVVDAILNALSARDVRDRGSVPSRTAAHLRVMATTGWPPAVIGMLTPDHLAQLTKSIVLRPGRRKGKGTGAERHTVTPQARAALRAFQAIGAWGPVPSSTRVVVWRRAVARVRRQHPDWTIPRDVRPYDLKHSFAESVLDATGDLSLVQTMLGHADIRSTRRYAAGAIPRSETAAAAKVGAFWKAATPRRGR